MAGKTLQTADQQTRSVLVTGAAGYLGSHAVAALTQANIDVVGVDDFRTSNPGVFDALEQLCGQRPEIIKTDVSDAGALSKIFQENHFDSVIHFAGLKSVGDSMADPLSYYRANLESAMSLLRVMELHDVRELVFSSSCTVYGDAASPIDETAQIRPVSPYGETKAWIEALMRRMAEADDRWRMMSLRYFNPIGADPSGLIGEDPSTATTTLMPHLLNALAGGRPLSVFGDDYPTPDGTCVRDYIHVSDLIDGHIQALHGLSDVSGFEALNLGTGTGVSVLEIIEACGTAWGNPVPYSITARRPGDATEVYADPSRAKALLGWEPTRSLAEACEDHIRWHRAHPRGYAQPREVTR